MNVCMCMLSLDRRAWWPARLAKKLQPLRHRGGTRELVAFLFQRLLLLWVRCVVYRTDTNHVYVW